MIKKQSSNPVIKQKLFKHVLGKKTSPEIKGHEHLSKEFVMFTKNVLKFFSTEKTRPGEAFELEDYRTNPTDHKAKEASCLQRLKKPKILIINFSTNLNIRKIREISKNLKGK